MPYLSGGRIWCSECDGLLVNELEEVYLEHKQTCSHYQAGRGRQPENCPYVYCPWDDHGTRRVAVMDVPPVPEDRR